MKKVVMFTNFLNHHQLPFCLWMQKLTNNSFVFVTQKAIATKRIGTYKIMDDYPFLLKSYENNDNLLKAYKLAIEAESVIIGSSNDDYISERLLRNKLTFRYSEHLFKNKKDIKDYLHNCYVMFARHRRNRKKQLYMLCSSAYAAGEFNTFGAYRNKTYKFGYFPENKEYDINKLMNNKDESILWAGRLIDWKHPEAMIEVAKRLKKETNDFKIKIIGSGNMEKILKDEVFKNNLENNVFILGSMTPEEVREYMEKASIFVTTSDKNEGWGAVLNEAMNSGCACVASHLVGAAGFLIKHNTNGYIYDFYNIDDLYNGIKTLLKNKEKRESLGRNAYKAIDELWNSKVAAERLLVLSEKLINGEDTPYLDGPCSKAKPISEKRMYEYLIQGNNL